MRNAISWLAVGGLILAFTVRVSADEIQDAKKVLTDLGIRTVGSNLTIADESKLGQLLRDTSKSKKALFGAGKALGGVQQQSIFLQNQIAGGKNLYIQINKQLANVNQNNVTLFNKLVAQSNATRGQIDLLIQQDKKLSGLLKASRKKMIDAREVYIQHVLDMRKLSNRIAEDYQTKAIDKEVREAIASLNTATGKEYQLDPSPSFKSYQRQLKKLEDTVLSEAIPLQRTANNTLYVTVVINKKFNRQMALDPGSTLVTLPNKMAEDLGIVTTDTDPTITLILGDGSRIKAKEVIIPEMRVGKFIVENVRCAVLGPDADLAEASLGMSFLENFKFEIDAQAAKLTMLKVETPGGRPNRKKR